VTTLSSDDDIIGRLSTWSLVLAGILAVLGGLALAAPWAASTVVDVFCGITLIAAGISQLVMTMGTFTWRGFWLTLLCGTLSIMAGTGMLVLPAAGIAALVTFLGLMLLFESTAKLVAAFTIREHYPWGWILLDGVITGVLGMILLTSRPAEAGVLLGVFVGISLLSSAMLFTSAGFSLRRSL
jgi:membrane protein HdeD